eukprot:m.342331 g.342331  ORF g.342331 m.342331 type:complete len:879 (+) comp21259_c0_seq1:142-2778(+)
MGVRKRKPTNVDQGEDVQNNFQEEVSNTQEAESKEDQLDNPSSKKSFDFMKWLCQYASDFSALDGRSLALHRMIMGIAVLFDIFVDFFPYAAYYFTDDLTSWHRRQDNISYRSWGPISLFMLSGDLQFAWLVLILDTLAAVAVIVGWNTKYTMPILWFTHYSVLGRVQDVLHGADPWMRILLFNAMFLPLDRAWAITPSKNSVNQGMKVVSIATFIHWANIMALYVRNWSVKLGGIAWNEEHTAVLISFGAITQVRRLGRWLRQFETFCYVASLGTMYVEGPVPVIGWFCTNPIVRFLCMFSLFSLHFGFLFTLAIGGFPIICMAPLVGCFPGELWDYILGPLPKIVNKEEASEGKDKELGEKDEDKPFGVAQSVFALGLAAALCYWATTEEVKGSERNKGTTQDFDDWFNIPPWYSIAKGIIGFAIFTTLFDELSRLEPKVPSIWRPRITKLSNLGKTCLLVFACFCTTFSDQRYKINNIAYAGGWLLPVGMFAHSFNDPGSSISYYIMPGVTRNPGENETVMDWYPFVDGPRPLQLEIPDPVSQLFPSVRLLFSLGTPSRFEKRGSNFLTTYWSSFGRGLCEKYKAQNLSVFQIYSVQGNFPARIDSVIRPVLRPLWSHTCHIAGSTICEHPDCPWSIIVNTVSNVYNRTYPPTENEKLLRSHFTPGLTVRYRPDLTSFDGFVRPGQVGKILHYDNQINPPVQVRWQKMPGIKNSKEGVYWAYWEQLELWTLPEKITELKQNNHNFFNALLPNRTIVRCIKGFEKVEPGTEGIYIMHNKKSPPIQIKFFPEANSTFYYFVHSIDFEVIGTVSLEEGSQLVAGSKTVTEISNEQEEKATTAEFLSESNVDDTAEPEAKELSKAAAPVYDPSQHKLGL